MKILFGNIPEEGLSLDLTERPEQFPVLAEIQQAGTCEFTDPVKIELDISRIRETVEVKGRVETRVKIGCRRCLHPFDTPARKRFRLYYAPHMPDMDRSATEDGIEISADVIEMVPFEGDEIDFREAIQEQVVMALPPWPLCDEECKGLCVKCGADLNQETCDCETETVDSPFAVLKNLKL